MIVMAPRHALIKLSFFMQHRKTAARLIQGSRREEPCRISVVEIMHLFAFTVIESGFYLEGGGERCVVGRHVF